MIFIQQCKIGKYGLINLENASLIEFKYDSIDYVKEANLILADLTTSVDIYDENLEIKKTGIISELNMDKKYFRLRENGDYTYYNFNFEKLESNKVLENKTLYLD